MKNELGAIQVTYLTNGIAVKEGPIKPDTILGGARHTGVTSFGIFMDAAGSREMKSNARDTNLEMNIPSALL